MVTFSTVFSAGHGNAQVGDRDVSTRLGYIVAGQSARHDPCDHTDRAHHQGNCCVSASSCFLCIPVDARVFVAAEADAAVPVPARFVSTPAHVPTQLRPPQTVVTG
jgi:hypothetical protein